jgi:CubicO group peptidase (beta-lactamase class C family)
MRALITSIALLLTAASGSIGEDKSQLDQRIQRIEHGLVEFTAPQDMLQPGATPANASKTLAERMAHYKIPGVSMAVINSNKIEWARAYGTIEVDGDVPVTKETLFQAASTSKLVVSAIALYFVEHGLLELDSDVNKTLKSWKVPESAFTEEHKITLRLLLTHQAGLNRPDGGFSWEDGSVPTLLQTLNGVAPAENKAAVIEYMPGSKWQYSNFGYVVIQQLVEDAVGEPFPEIAHRIIFEPLGMKSSTFRVPLSGGYETNEALPHDAEGTTHMPDMHPTAVANGGLMTTPTDLALFTHELILAYRGESDRIVSTAMVRKMFHRELDLDPAVLGIPLGEGLGVLLYGKGEGFSFLHPGDNMPGASSWLMGFPDAANGIVIMTNGAMGNLLAMELVAAIINEYSWPPASH